jgi:Ca2+-binding RTX toxin-like protein
MELRNTNLHFLNTNRDGDLFVAQNAYEQYMLELINRARLDPAAEAALYGVSLGTISASSKQPLAANDLLLAAAEKHSQWMLDTDTFSHTGAGGSDPGTRMAAAGYAFTGNWSWGENIAWQGTTGTLNLVATIKAEHAALFQSSGHRANILNDTFQEVGVGITTGTFGSYNAAMVTQDFAKSGTGAFLTGVAYTDTDGDKFYSVGEGRGGVQIAMQQVGGGTTTVTTDAPGGYDAKLANGTYNVTMSGGGLGAALGMTITMASRNIKLDLLGTTAVACSASLIMGANLVGLTLLGTDDLSGTGNALANVIAGNKGANLIDGGTGADTLTGGLGNDTFVMKAGQADGDVINDFSGNGSAVGDTIKFDGYGPSATLVHLTGNQYQISDGTHVDKVTIVGAVDTSDYSFVNTGSSPPPPPPPPGGGTSDLILVGTTGADNLVGGSGNDSLSGLNGNDTLVGGTGADTLAGGAGNDLIVLGNSATVALVDGGTNSSNTLSASKGDVLAFDSVLDLTSLANSKVTGIETISMVDSQSGGSHANDTLTLNASDVINLGTGHINPTGSFGAVGTLGDKDAVRVDGDGANDTVNLSGGGWTQVTGTHGAPAGYNLYVHDSGGGSEDAYVLVQATLTVHTS